MSGSRPQRVIDPVCGMSVDVARAEADGLTIDHDGRTYAFCRAGCRRAFEEEPATYAARADAAAAVAAAVTTGAGVGRSAAPLPQAGGLPVIDEGMRRWYESCSCCLSDAYPDIKAALDAEREAASAPPVDPGICEVAEAEEAAAT